MTLSRVALLASFVLSLSLAACKKDNGPAFKAFSDTYTQTWSERSKVLEALDRVKSAHPDDAKVQAEADRLRAQCATLDAVFLDANKAVPAAAASSLEDIEKAKKIVDTGAATLAQVKKDLAALEASPPAATN